MGQNKNKKDDIDAKMRKKSMRMKTINNHQDVVLKAKLTSLDRLAVLNLEGHLKTTKELSEGLRACNKSTGACRSAIKPEKDDSHGCLVGMKSMTNPWSYFGSGTIETWEKSPKSQNQRGGSARPSTAHSRLNPRAGSAVGKEDLPIRPKTVPNSAMRTGSLNFKSNKEESNRPKSVTFVAPGEEFRSKSSTPRKSSRRHLIKRDTIKTPTIAEESDNERTDSPHVDSTDGISKKLFTTQSSLNESSKDEGIDIKVYTIGDNNLHGGSGNPGGKHVVGGSDIDLPPLIAQENRTTTSKSRDNTTSSCSKDRVDRSEDVDISPTRTPINNGGVCSENNPVQSERDITLDSRNSIKSGPGEDSAGEEPPLLMPTLRRLNSNPQMVTSTLPSGEQPRSRRMSYIISTLIDPNFYDDDPARVFTPKVRRPERSHFYVKPQYRYKSEDMFLMRRYTMLQKQMSSNSPISQDEKLKINVAFSVSARKKALGHMVDSNTQQLSQEKKRIQDTGIQTKVDNFLESIGQFIKENKPKDDFFPDIVANNEVETDKLKVTQS